MLTRKKVLLSILMVIVMLMTVACSTINNSNKPQKEDTSLNVIYHNQKIDDVDISEGWLENNVSNNTLNLSDTDKVNVIIEVEGESLLDRYLSQSTYADMKDYAISAEGDNAVRELTEIQNNVKELIDVLEYEIDYGFSYTSLFNGFSATINYGDVEKLEKLQIVNRVIVCEKYAVPDTIDVDRLEATMQTTTGLYSNNTNYHGEGMVIAVLDNGFDYDHPAFCQNVENPSINKDYIEKLLSSLYIQNNNSISNANQLYIRNKIPYQYDYADNDADVLPDWDDVHENGGYHGTHVAGIAGGYEIDNDIISAAYNAQLVMMKVFCDYGGGAPTDAIVSALSDCAVLGVDVINMSLGAPAGFTYERYEDLFYVNEMYQLLEKLGISVITSAGNSYSQSILNRKGATDPSNPDNGVIGSPSSYAYALSIASVDAYQTSWFWKNDYKVYMASARNSEGGIYNCVDMLLNNEQSVLLNIIPVPNAGEESDYNGLDVTGKTVLVQRGKISFEEKQKIAAKFGAKACIIYNNEERKLFGAQVNELVIPTFTILMEDGLKLASEYSENGKAELQLNKFSKNYTMSDFSSWGCGSDLSLKPEITAPGGNIYSTFPTYYDEGEYGYLSGTSMAAPNLTAVNAVVRQYLKENFPSLTNRAIKTLSYQLLMSTAILAVDDYSVAVSPRKQGAGVADVNAAVNTKAYLTVTGSDRTKLELGDDKNRDGIYTLNFNLVNFDTRALSYDINAIVMTETVVNGLTAERGHLFTDRKLNISVKNAAINGTVVTVEAGNTAKLTITITLTEEEKAYLEELFINGMYVEGFATLTAIEEDSEDLSIPFLAFYGDWTDAPVFDKTLYSNEEPFIAPIILWGDYNGGCRMGDYQWLVPEGYEKPLASCDKITLSNVISSNEILDSVYLPLLRNINELYYRIYDPITGIDYYISYGYNIRKAFYSNGSIYIPEHFLYISTNDFDFMNNQNLVFEIKAIIEYNNQIKEQILEFPIRIDSEAPTLINSELRQENDKYYIDAEIYDNYHLSQVFIATQNDDGKITILDNPIPVYDSNWTNSTKNKISLDITQYMEKFNNGKICIVLEDTGYNSSSYYLMDYVPTNNEINNVSNNVNFDIDNKEYFENQTEQILYENTESYSEDYITTSSETEHKFIINDDKLISYEGPGGEVTIPDGVKIIGKSVFRKNLTITKVIMSNSVEEVQDEAFHFCRNLEEVVFSQSLRVLGKWSFSSCALKNIDLQNTKIDTIGQYSFYDCRSLEKVVIEETAELINIGRMAFSLLTSCEYIEVNANVKMEPTFSVLPLCKKIVFNKNLDFKAYDNAFIGLDSIEIIEFHGNVGMLGNGSNSTMLSCIPVQRVEFFGNVEGINGRIFSGCSQLKEIIFHGYIKSINRLYAFGNTNLKQFTIAPDNKYMTIDPETGIMYYNNDKSNMMMTSKWDYDGVFKISDEVTELQPAQFSNSGYAVSIVYSIDDLSTPGSVILGIRTTMSPYREERTGLKGVILNDKITKIPDCCFKDNINLVNVQNTENIKEIGEFAFTRCYSLEKFDGSNIDKIKGYAFRECRLLKTFEFKDTVQRIETNTFDGCESLEVVDIKNITYVGPHAFKNCASLVEVKTNNKINFVASYAFHNCVKLESITFDEKLRTLGDNIFENCKMLKSIKIPDNLTSTGTGIFKNCTNLEEVYFSKNVKFIREYTFYNCSSLKSFNFSDKVLYIDSYAFAKTGLVKLELPSSIQYFDLGTSFMDCNNLESISIPETCKIAKSIDGVLYNIDFTEVILYPVAKHGEDFVLDSNITTIGSFAFANTIYLKSIKADGVTSINDNAFLGSAIETLDAPLTKFFGNAAFKDSHLNSIDLGNAIEIDGYAFDNTNIKEVQLVNTLEYIGSHAFANCKNLNSITIEKNCANFDYAFVFENSPITNINIENGNTNFVLEDGILYNGAKTIIHDYIGNGTGKLSIAEGIIKISAYAFANSNFSEVELPESLEIISDKAFYGTENLRTFIFNSQKAPKLESRYEEERVYCYNNFVDYIENIVANKMELTMYHPADTSYHDYIYEMYFANRYEESEESYIKLNVKVSDVNNMMEEVVNGNTALIEEASKLYSMMTETQKSCVNNSEMLNINDMALAVKANDNVYIVIAALFTSLVAFAVIASKRK